MSTKPEVKATPRHSGALDRYYMEVCPGCSMPAGDCTAGSANETACILADLREIWLRIEAKLLGGKPVAEY